MTRDTSSVGNTRIRRSHNNLRSSVTLNKEPPIREGRTLRGEWNVLFGEKRCTTGTSINARRTHDWEGTVPFVETERVRTDLSLCRPKSGCTLSQELGGQTGAGRAHVSGPLVSVVEGVPRTRAHVRVRNDGTPTPGERPDCRRGGNSESKGSVKRNRGLRPRGWGLVKLSVSHPQCGPPGISLLEGETDHPGDPTDSSRTN